MGGAGVAVDASVLGSELENSLRYRGKAGGVGEKKQRGNANVQLLSLVLAMLWYVYIIYCVLIIYSLYSSFRGLSIYHYPNPQSIGPM